MIARPIGALDAVIVFLLAGGMRQVIRRRAPAAAAFVLAIIAVALFTAGQAFAQTSDEQALKSTLETRLAYVVTGDAEVDRISKAGLQGLTLFLAQRTALEAGEPISIGVDTLDHRLEPGKPWSCHWNAADRTWNEQAPALVG